MDSLEALRARKSRATDKDQVSGLLYAGVHIPLRAWLGAEAAKSLLRPSFIPERMAHFSRFPVRGFLELLEAATEASAVTGRELGPTLRRLGSAVLEAYLDSPEGRLTVAVNGGDAHRMLGALPAAYRSLLSFGMRKTRNVSDQEALVRFEGDYLGPEFHAGALESAIRESAQVQANVAVSDVSGDGCNFTLGVVW